MKYKGLIDVIYLSSQNITIIVLPEIEVFKVVLNIVINHYLVTVVYGN